MTRQFIRMRCGCFLIQPNNKTLFPSLHLNYYNIVNSSCQGFFLFSFGYLYKKTIIKDTCTMRLFHYIQLVPALLIFSLNACTSVHAPLLSISELDVSSEQLTPLPSLNSEANDSSSQSAEPYWDVSNVDISDVDLDKKLIAFTFDDAPARTMESILAVFAEFNEKNSDCKASATIFFNGALFNDETPHLLYSACALGFELGNHTQSHHDLTTLDKETLLLEIETTDGLLEKVDGQKTHLLRAPFGRVNEQVKSCAKTPLIDWTIDTLDWTGASENDIYNTIFNNRFSGAIALMHDGYEGTVSALKRLLPDLKEDGYQVVSVSKMIKVHGCKFRNGNVYIRARKQK